MPDSKPFDVFLSHNSQDKPAVEKLAGRLEDEARLKPWLDSWNLVPGEPWQEALEQALDSSRTCAVFIGPGSVGPWQNEEMRAALDDRTREKGFRVIPVLLPGASMPERGALPRFLSRLTWVDFRTRDGLDDAVAFRKLCAGIEGVGPGRGAVASPAGAVPECPYRGLEAFDEAHAKFFFGREALTQHLVEELRETRFLAAVGASGSGKSSLARAGLLPQLKAGALPLSERWSFSVFKPGEHPLQELALALCAPRQDDRLSASLRLLDSLRADERALHLHVRLAMGNEDEDVRQLILVDQCEEALTLCQDAQERERFIGNLRYAATIAGGRTVVVITMRADFLARAAAITDFAELLSGHQFLVSPMDEEDMRLAIEEPARAVGLSLEDGLAERMIKDVGSEPGALPLLEHSLLSLFEQRDNRNLMTLSAYAESGGVQGAVAKRAEEIFDRLTPIQQEVARRLLLRLTQPGEGTEDTRRRAPMSELWTRDDERAEVERVVKLMADARLLTTGTDAAGERQVDVAHEALIRGWPRLRAWIEEDRAALRLHRRVTEAAREWERERDPGFLLRGARLAQAAEWRKRHEAALNRTERDFLDASARLEKGERSAATRRRWLTAVGILAVISLVTLYVIWRQERKATLSRTLAAHALGQLETDPELSLLLAMEAARESPTSEAESALRQALAESSDLVAVMRGHNDEVLDLSLSSDGSRAVTASRDGTARIWDVRTGQPLFTLNGGERRFMALAAFTPDNEQVITLDYDLTGHIETLKSWDAATGAEIATFNLDYTRYGFLTFFGFSPDGKLLLLYEGGAQVWEVQTRRKIMSLGGWTTFLAFSPTGRILVTSDNAGSLQLWDVSTGQRSTQLSGPAGKVLRVHFSADEGTLTAVSDDLTVRKWDARTGASLSSAKPEGAQMIVAQTAFSNDGSLLAVRDGTGPSVWVFDTAGTFIQKLGTLVGHTGAVRSMSFSPNGKYIVTASEDNTARLWDGRTGLELAQLRGHSATVSGATFSADGKFILTRSDDGTARVWKTYTPPENLTVLRGHTGTLWFASLNVAGDRVVTASDDQTARIWDSLSGNSLRTLKGHEGTVETAVFSADGKRVLTASADKTACIWDAETGRSLLTISGHAAPLRGGAFSPDGRLVVTGGEDNIAPVWDARTGQSLLILQGHIGGVNAVAFSPDGKFIATASSDGTARIWDAQSGESRLILRGHRGGLYFVAFNHDGNLLVTASEDRTARIWDARTGQSLRELRGHLTSVRGAGFSADSKFVVTSADDSSARVWDTATGRSIAVIQVHSGPVNSAAFSLDGKHIITASTDGTAVIAPCDLCVPLDDLLAKATAKLRPSRTRLTDEEREKFLREQ